MTVQLNSLHCVSFGVVFELTADSEVVLAQMLENAPMGTQVFALPSQGAQHFTLLRAGVGSRHLLKVDDQVVAEGPDLQHILEHLASELRTHVTGNAPDRVFVHAGVVGLRGHALVLPGASFAGKTTLVAELVRAGAVYYSDEYAVIDEHGLVHPYPRNLQMRVAGGREQRSIAVECLNGGAGDAPLPVSQVVFTEYVESACWSPEPMSDGMAVLELLRHSIPVQRTPARVMATLVRMMESATAVRSPRGEASETARLLLSAMTIGVGRPSV